MNQTIALPARPTFFCEVCEDEHPASAARRCRIGQGVLHVCEGCFEGGLEQDACHPFDCDRCGAEIEYSETPNWTATLAGVFCAACAGIPE